MALFRNVSGMNQFIEEHRKTIGPNEEVELSEDEMKIRSYAKGLAKGGWLIPVLEDVVVQSVQQTIDNDHVTHQPEQPFNIDLNIPMGGLKAVPDEKSLPLTPQQKAIEEAIARKKAADQEQAQNAAIQKAIGGYDDENVYVHTPVKHGSYGNIEHNTSEAMTRMTVPPGIDEGITHLKDDDIGGKMLEAQMQKAMEDPKKKPTAELHLQKEAEKSPKVIPPSKVVKKANQITIINKGFKNGRSKA